MRRNKFLILNNIFPLLLSVLMIISCSGKTGYLPKSLAGLKLIKTMTGSEATSYVDKLHFSKVASGKENDIGFYEKEGKTAVIYLTYYSGKNEAEKDFELMTKKISPENSVFISPSFFNLKGYTIYRCFGMGQTHFVFTHKSVLIWLSVDTVKGKDFLNNYIAFIN